MPLEIVRNDITKMDVDAIVNAANESLLGGGGVDGAIHRAAGPGLLAECRGLGGCRTGEAKITAAYRLPCRHVIHTVGPVWQGGGQGEREALVSCYRSSLALALRNGCTSVAFPLISSGIYGYPKDQALRVAVDTIGAFLREHELTVYLVIFDRASYQIGAGLFADIAQYIDDHYVDEHAILRREQLSRTIAPSAPLSSGGAKKKNLFKKPSRFDEAEYLSDDASASGFTCGAPRTGHDVCAAPCPPPPAAASLSVGAIPFPEAEDDLSGLMASLDAGFSETLLKLIDRTGKKDSEIYKKANVDRKLFSKIRNNPDYKPSKTTAIAFAIALELDLDGTRDLIGRAGYALTRSSRFDVIIEYFIRKKSYDVFAINEALFAFDQSLLGA